MAIPELLVGSVFQPTVQVGELVGGVAINQIGADVTTGNTMTTNLAYKTVTNFVVEYRGEILVLANDGTSTKIWGYNRGTGMWTERVTIGAHNDFIPQGMWVINTGTTQRVVALIAKFNVVRNWYVSYSDDGSSFTTSTIVFNSAVAGGRTGKGIEFNNKIYKLETSGTIPYCYEFDPVAVSGSSIPPGWPNDSVTNTDQGCFYVYDDRLFCAHLDSNMNMADFALYEFTGGGWSLNTQITNDNRNTLNPQVSYGASCMFTDPTTGDLILATNGMDGGTAYGSMAFRLTPSGSTFTVTEITSTVVPSGLRPGARGATTNAAQDRWFVFVNTDVPGSPEVYCFVAPGPSPGTGYSVYQWQGVGAEMTLFGTGPSTVYAIPESPAGGGARIHKGLGNQPAIESAQAVVGGWEISYRVYGSLLNQNVTLWYSLGQEYPDQQATISAQTGGTGISGGNTVTGVDGDDGATLYTLLWDLASDGVPNGDACHIFLDMTV